MTTAGAAGAVSANTSAPATTTDTASTVDSSTSTPEPVTAHAHAATAAGPDPAIHDPAPGGERNAATPAAPGRAPHSATLAIDEAARALRDAGHEVLHLGLGESGLPVEPTVLETLAGAATQNGYGPVAGSPTARAAAAGWFTRRSLATDPGQILFAPGSKSLLFALLAAIGGDVVLPRPAWVTYAAQAALLGRRVISVPVPPESGGVPDPELLEPALRAARAAGAEPRVMILTVPDNPTGTIASAERVRAVCAIAEHHGLAIISDEIYAELCHDGQTPPSAAHELPERTIVTTGLSKSMALGGWRIGFLRTPDGPWGRQLYRDLTGVASEMWSSLASPMQAVATRVLDDPPHITAHIAASRRLHARVANAAYRRLTAVGVACRPPQAGFYLYADFTAPRDALRAQSILGSADLSARLLDRHHVATLPGTAFGDRDDALTVRMATSLLYGSTTEQRQAALDAAVPEELPWISAALDRLSTAVTSLVEPAQALAGSRG